MGCVIMEMINTNFWGVWSGIYDQKRACMDGKHYHLYSQLHIRLIEMKRKVGKDDVIYKEDLKSKITE